MACSQDSDGFIVVKQSKGRRNKRSTVNKTQRNTVITNKLTSIDIQDAKTKILECKRELQSEDSNFMKDVMDSLAVGDSFRQIHCHGLGQLTSVISRYQAAFLLILKEELKVCNENTFVFDPIFCEDEKTLLRDLGMVVEEDNRQGGVKCEVKSLVILPHCPKELSNNLVYVNYKAGTESNLVLISNSISMVILRTCRTEIQELCPVLDAVHAADLVDELAVSNTFRHDDVFNDLAIHRFGSSAAAAAAGSSFSVEKLPEPGGCGSEELL